MGRAVGNRPATSFHAAASTTAKMNAPSDQSQRSRCGDTPNTSSGVIEMVSRQTIAATAASAAPAEMKRSPARRVRTTSEPTTAATISEPEPGAHDRGDRIEIEPLPVDGVDPWRRGYGVVETRPDPPRRHGEHRAEEPHPESNTVARILVGAGRVEQAREIALPGAEELLPQRLGPQHDADADGGEERRAVAGPGAPTIVDDEGSDAGDDQRRHDQQIAEVGLHAQGSHRHRDRQGAPAPGEHGPHQHQEAEERQDQDVRLPDVEQQVAPQRPGQDGGRQGDAGCRAVAVDPPGHQHADPDRGDVEHRGAHGESDRSTEDTNRDREVVEEQRPRMVDVTPGRQRRRRGGAEQRVVAGEHVPRPQLDRRVVTDRLIPPRQPTRRAEHDHRRRQPGDDQPGGRPPSYLRGHRHCGRLRG